MHACSITKSCPTLYNPTNCSPPGSSVQARTLEGAAISSSSGSTQPRDQTSISCVCCIGRWIFYHSATWEAAKKPARCLLFTRGKTASRRYHFIPTRLVITKKTITSASKNVGEGDGISLQYSCLENLMDKGAWQATVHGITKSWT